MKFGIALTPHWSGKTDQAAVYRHIIDRIVMAERLGYYSAWTTEHHFANDPDYAPFDWEDARFRAYDLAPDPLTLLTFAAARTSQIRLGTGVLLINYDNPIRLAERSAMLDVMSGGRIELGIGRGGGHPHTAAFGIPDNDIDSQERFREALHIILRAWSGERFEFHGKHFDFGRLEVVPTPVQRPYQHTNATGIPLYSSTHNAENLVEHARLSMSHVTVTGAWGGEEGFERYNARQATFQNAARENGIDPSTHLYPGHLFMFCAPTDAEAEDVAGEYILKFIAHVEAHYQRQRRGGLVLGSLMGPNATLEEARQAAKKGFSNNLIGSPKTIAEKLSAFLDKVPSLNYVGCLTDAGAPPIDFVNRSMEMFAREVMPRFAGMREPLLKKVS